MADGPPHTVLVVEDDGSFRNILQVMLRGLKVEMLGAGTGEEALQLAVEHRQHIALVLADMRLPDTNGYKVAEAVRIAIPSVKTVFMSTRMYEEIVAAGWAIPRDRYLRKPFGPDALRDQIRLLFPET